MYKIPTAPRPYSRKVQIAVMTVIVLVLLALGAQRAYSLWQSHTMKPEEIYFLKGMELLKTEDRANLLPAINAFSAAIEANPNYAAEAYVKRGIAFRLFNMKKESLDDFNHAIELQPTLAEAYYERAYSFGVEQKKTTEALADLDKAIALNNDYFAALLARGIAYVGLTQFDKALADLNKAAKLIPKNDKEKEGTLYLYRGSVFYSFNRFDEALADFDQLVRLFPEGGLGYRNRGRAYFEKGMIQQGVKDFTQSIVLEPTYDLSAYLPYFQNRAAELTDPDDKAALEGLIRKIQR